MTEPRDHVVIVGAGQAGVQLADSLRQLGSAARITLVGDEQELPYQRPPLSKDYLSAHEPAPDALSLRGPAFFEASAIGLRTGVRVESIDRLAGTAMLSDSSELSYTHLVLATGARNRALAVAGCGLRGVMGLRTLDDAKRLRQHLERSSSVVVIGAGFIGLEFAASAVERGLEVTVVELADRPMQRVLTPAMSEYFVDALVRQGIHVRYGVSVTEIMGEAGSATGVKLATGEVLRADLVVAGIGVVPNDELAAAAGLDVAGGVVVDSSFRTSDSAIFAVGDCARYPSVHSGGMARLESVQNATDHARHLAAHLAGGEASEYREVPWFWSQQGSLRLNIVGIADPQLDTLVRGQAADDKFSIFGYRGDELVCVESVNSPSDHLAARRMLAMGKSPSREQVVDQAFDLKDFSRAPVPY